LNKIVATLLVLGIGIGALAYLSKPDVRMKLGSQRKCKSHGKFVEGLYGTTTGTFFGSKFVEQKHKYSIEIHDKPSTPYYILERGYYPDYESFASAFDEACRLGTIGLPVGAIGRLSMLQ